MSDLIDRQAVLALPRSITRNMRGKVVEESIDVEMIKALPPVQPKRGRWLKDGDAHYCSECGVGILEFGHGGEPIYFVEGYNRANRERCITTPGWCSYYMQFCPYCGADMRGEQNE